MLNSETSEIYFKKISDGCQNLKNFEARMSVLHYCKI